MENALGRLQRILRAQRRNRIAGIDHEHDVVAFLRWLRANPCPGGGALRTAARARALSVSSEFDRVDVKLLSAGLVHERSGERTGSGTRADPGSLLSSGTSGFPPGVLADASDQYACDET